MNELFEHSWVGACIEIEKIQPICIPEATKKGIFLMAGPSMPYTPPSLFFFLVIK